MGERQPIIPDLDSGLETLEDFARSKGNTFFPEETDMDTDGVAVASGTAASALEDPESGEHLNVIKTKE